MNSGKESNQGFVDWSLLYRWAAYGAWFSALLIPLAVFAHIMWPPPSWQPGAAEEWFQYLNEYPLAGLLNLDLALEVGLIVTIPFYMALYLVLNSINKSLTILAVFTALLGILLHLLSNSAWEMWLLSKAYADAPTAVQTNIYIAAGEARLSVYYGMVFQVSYILGYLAYIMIGCVMLDSPITGKTSAYLAIVIGIAGFGFYLPVIGVLISVLVVILIGIWNILVGWRLFQLSRIPSHNKFPE